MIPTYPNNSQPASLFPVGYFNEDQQHQVFFSPNPQSSSSSSMISYPTFFGPTLDQGGYYCGQPQQLQHQEEADKFVSYGISHDHPTLENERDCGLKLSICKKEDGDENQSENASLKWMSSKMRLMRKMMNFDQTGAETKSNTTQKHSTQKQLSSPLETDNSSNNTSNNSNNITIRVCADCNTTKTPLWRSGPKGPKSLCNACGIRQRKARRAMAAAAAAANGTILALGTKSVKTKVQHKDKKSSNGYVVPYKKRFKLSAPSLDKKKLCFEDFTVSLSKNSAYHQVFPQDEKEAAILLMALSCGLVHG